MPSISVSIFVSLRQGNRVCSPVIPCSIEASFAQSTESAILDHMILNVNIFGSIYPTVLEFKEPASVSVFYTLKKCHVNRLACS